MIPVLVVIRIDIPSDRIEPVIGRQVRDA